MATNKQLQDDLKMSTKTAEGLAKELAKVQAKLKTYEPEPAIENLMDKIRNEEEATVAKIRGAIETCEASTGRKLLDQVKKGGTVSPTTTVSIVVDDDLAKMIKQVSVAKESGGQCSMTRIMTDLGEIANSRGYQFDSYIAFQSWANRLLANGWKSNQALM